MDPFTFYNKVNVSQANEFETIPLESQVFGTQGWREPEFRKHPNPNPNSGR